MRPFVALVAAAALLMSSCSPEPAPDYQAGVTEEDHAYGAEQHPQLLAEFGGEYAGAQQIYVRRLGETIARAAGLDGQCTFTLVNSDVVNAFAVPGCFIYVTRGLMAIVDSEAELASVLGHEVGHIVAQHSQRQQKQSLWGTLGVLAVSLTGSEQLVRLAGAAAQLFTLRYSRSQEYEADELGIRYLMAAGYDPYAAADMLAALERQQAFITSSGGQDSAKSLPEWASSHPLTDKRVDRTRALAAATGLADDAAPERKAEYLAAVDGLLFGDDPEQGFVIGQAFAHPMMRIGFEAPAGFSLTNSPQAIGISGPGETRGEFGGGKMPAGGLDEYGRRLIAAVAGRARASLGKAERTRINGLPALIMPFRIDTDGGQLPLVIAAYDAGDGVAYHFVMAGQDSAAAAIRRLFASFRLLSADEAARLHPRQLRVVNVGHEDSADSLGRRMADPNGPALLTIINDPAAIKAGNKVKIVVRAGI